MGKIKVAIIGVGNCASSLVQGVYYYRNAAEDAFIPGLMHVDLGGYHVGDIRFVAAFDIDKNKVGKVTRQQVREIAQRKVKDLNAATVEAAMRIVEGTARSMGIEVVE